VRSLPAGGSAYGWRWRAPTAARPWGWCRVYHRGAVSPQGDTPRSNGPRARFDPHRAGPTGPREDPAGRSILYAGVDLATSACEVFGETGAGLLCPSYRVALLRPTKPLTLFDLRTLGSALIIGAIPALADGEYPRAQTQTQAWALAIYEDIRSGRTPTVCCTGVPTTAGTRLLSGTALGRSRSCATVPASRRTTR